jgi:hypothetical protein
VTGSLAEALVGKMSFRALALGSLVLPSSARSRYLEEWLGELDVLPGRWRRARFARQVLTDMPRLAWALRDGAWVLRLARWVLVSDLRTWTALTPFVGWLVAATAHDGLGDAAVVLITVPPILGADVRWLRDKLDLE